MSEQKHTPEPWRFDSVEMKIKGFGDLHGRAVIANVSAKMDYARGKNTQYANAKRIVECINALAGIENPAEWVRILKEERVESHVSYWKEKAENSDWRYKELQSENERLKAEIEDLKRYKQAMIDGSNTDISLLWEGEGDKPKKVLYEEEIAALKAELANAKFQAWDEGYRNGYVDGIFSDLEPIQRAENPYKQLKGE